MPAGLEGKRIVVTGAAGFIGGVAVRALVDAGGEVIGLVRRSVAARRIGELGARLAVAPLAAGAALDSALAGADVLVHLAYDIRADAEQNLAAFDAVMAAAGRAGVSHIVHASSVVVYDEWPHGRLNEQSPIGQRLATGYRAAKIAMERRLLDGACPATILQPTIVWGAGSALWTERPMQQLRAGRLVLPEPCGKAALVHVADVARAVAAAAALKDPGHARVLVSGLETPSWDALFEGYRAIVGGTLLREPTEELRAALPPPAAGASDSGPGFAARASALLRGIVGHERFEWLLAYAAGLRLGQGPARLGASDLALFTASPRIDTARMAQLLGILPQIELEQGLALLRLRHFGTVRN